MPVFGLVDCDPDGINILKCYLYGSKNLAQEHGCNMPEIKWIGLKAEDVVPLRHTNETSIQLTVRDRAIALSMLESDEWRDDSGEILPSLRECAIELQRLLMLGRKAEIQILDEMEGGIYAWLTKRLEEGLRGRFKWK